MGTMRFKCPVCGHDIHFKDKDNVFPVNYKLKCKFCTSIFGFVPKVFVKADFTLSEGLIEEKEIENILDFDPYADDNGPLLEEELTSAIDEFEKHTKKSI
jgi:hypothetical protein